MTKYEIVSRFLGHKGYKVIQGKLDETVDLEAIVPWLLMDLQKTMYNRHIKDLNAKQELKTDRAEWLDAYLKFNDKVFLPFKEDEHGEIIEFMDQLEEYVGNDLALIRLAVMKMVPTENILHRQVVSEAYLCNVLTNMARTIHHTVFKEVKPMTHWQKKYKYFQEFTTEPTPELDEIDTCSARWTTNYVKKNGIGNVRRSKEIDDLTNLLCKKVVRWVKEVA